MHGYKWPINCTRTRTVGGFALAAAVSQPCSALHSLTFSFNTAFDTTPTAPPSVPWSQPAYQAVITAFAEALPHSFLSVLDIGYASISPEGQLLRVRTPTLGPPPPPRGVSAARLQHLNGGAGAGGGKLSKAARWLGVASDSLAPALGVPLRRHTLYALVAARQRLAWAIGVYGCVSI